MVHVVRRILCAALFACAWPLPPSLYAAEAPIKLIVPLPPGGPVDAVARKLASLITQGGKRTVIVENMSGAYGAIGLGHLMRAAPDGNTIAIAASGMLVLAPLVDSAVSYNPVRDFSALGAVAEYANVLVVNPGLPIKTTQQLIDYAKKNPTTLTFASSGSGSSNQLAAELLKMKADAPMLHIPYKGTAPALTDVIAGHASLMFDVISSSAPYIQAGNLRAIATTGKQRSPLLKDVPTVAETLPGFEVIGWFGLLAPPAAQPGVLTALNALIAPVANGPEFRAFLAQNGYESPHFAPQDLASRIKDDVAIWAPVVKSAGLGKKTQ
jgi:tripartite-type tricarboxylate transporter receptor subunit TctC